MKNKIKPELLKLYVIRSGLGVIVGVRMLN
jgi:hypothetical protein